MKLYHCRVNLGGDVGAHEVPKRNITDKELRLLKNIHGDDSIRGLEPAGEVERDDGDEYKRLAMIYMPRRVEKFFGITLDNYDDWLNEQIAQGEVEGRHGEAMRELREVAVPMPGAAIEKGTLRLPANKAFA